ncbi:MAG TPA: S8 family serine peptidase [Anaerolineales bacterium]|nr:S8 family serine peptidase [Anaerolineales bacterium]
MFKRIRNVVNLLVILAMLFATTAAIPAAAAPAQDSTTATSVPSASGAETSHRLIVELSSPPLVVWAQTNAAALQTNGKVDSSSPEAQLYLAQLQAEQEAFIADMQSVLPDAQVDYFVDEFGAQVDLTYQIVFNGLAIDPGMDTKMAERLLSALPNVKAVYPDYAHQPDLYASVPLINAPVMYESPEIGGIENAGAGIKVASMDGGAHHEAEMFDGTGYSYPADFPPNGLGLIENNNGKIIASRVYFRSWDPPIPEDANPWPGPGATSHGTHTASTAAGNEVVAEYGGITVTLSGVAPAAWVMSYRVFYHSVNGIGSFYSAEGIAALEDIAIDGADVLNNSWGGGPTSVGGEFDPLDQALINTANSGVFVTMSNGNAGPGYGTGDHPSSEYINVAASTTDGTYAMGAFNVIAPEPITDTLQDIPFSTASFGGDLPAPGEVITYSFVTAESVAPANVEGCVPFPAGSLTGKAVMISRGTCEFGMKVLNAELGGAAFAVIYNHAAGGDALINMGPGAVGDQVTIPSIFIGNTAGVGMIGWYNDFGDDSVAALDMTAFQIGNTPDFIASFSSRGPGAGNVLKPDITAPGVNILAQGYGEVPGGNPHLGYGQASGTSMAAPHVTGAAALLRQVHPDWSNAYIKSAMMSTSKYQGIWIDAVTHAQPLDMGAGRLDLTNAADPGVILDPPSLSFGNIITGTVQTITVNVTSVAETTQVYTLGAELIAGTYPTPTIDALPSISFDVASISLEPGATASFVVTFDPSLGFIGDNQGHVTLESADYFAHMPAWARVSPEPTGSVLVIDNDSSWLLGLDDYQPYYTSVLDNLGIDYDVWVADYYYGNATTIPDAAWLAAYDAVIYFTGDHYQPDGTYTVATPLTALDMNILTEYANGGGVIIAMGQDMAAVLASDVYDDGTLFYNFVLGGNWLQDSVTNYALPSALAVASPDGPAALQGATLNLRGPSWSTIDLLGTQEITPVATVNFGEANFAYNIVEGVVVYDLAIYANEAMTITSIDVYAGEAGENGPMVENLVTGPITVAAGSDFTDLGLFVFTDTMALYNGELYLNVLTEANPDGELRGQIYVAPSGDGAGNALYIDEIEALPWLGGSKESHPYMPLFEYPGLYNEQSGTIGITHRSQPTLENPGLDYLGRSVYTTFGLESINNGVAGLDREQLMNYFFAWAMDEPTVTISDTTGENTANLTTLLAETPDDAVKFRWDFGDGSAFTDWSAGPEASHYYAACGDYTVRVEMINIFGNHAIGEAVITASQCPEVGDLEVTPLADAQTGSIGETIKYTLEITNNGTTDDIFDITVSGNAWTVLLPEPVGPLAPGESAVVEISVTIPLGTAVGASDVAEVTFTSRVDPAQEVAATLTTSADIIVYFLPWITR